MTELKLNSAAGDSGVRQTGLGTRSWIGLVVALGFAVVALNAAVFLIVRSNERAIEQRETEVRRRLVDVEAREARLEALKADIQTWDQKKQAAENDAQQAIRAAADANSKKADRDRLLRDISESTDALAKLRSDATALNGQIALAKNEEATIRATLVQLGNQTSEAERARKQLDADVERLRADHVRLTAQRDNDSSAATEASRLAADQKKQLEDIGITIRERRRELDQVEASLQSAKAQRDAININQGATQQAILARNDAEKALSISMGQLQTTAQSLTNAQADLVRVQADVGRMRDLQRSIQIDQAMAQQAAKDRTDLEAALAKLRADIDATRSTKTEIDNAVLRQSGILANDKASTEKAAAARIEAEKELNRLRGELQTATLSLSNSQSELARLQDEVSRLKQDVSSLRSMKASIDANEAAAAAARTARVQEEASLSRAKGELEAVRQQLAEDQARRANVLADIDRQKSTFTTRPADSAQPPPNPAAPLLVPSGIAPPSDTPKN